jgi:ABC-2 type transport system permease protein
MDFHPIKSQWQVIRRDRWLLACLTLVPAVLALMMWSIFSGAITRDLPIGVVDLSHSQLSRRLIRELDAHPTLEVDQSYQDVSKAAKALSQSHIYAYIVIPYEFDKAIYRHQQPRVSTFYNSQFILMGRLVNSAVLQVQGTFNAKIDTVLNLASGGQTTLSAMGRAVPVQTQLTPLFNKNMNYAQFLISGIIPAIWQIAMVVGTIMVLAANYRFYGLRNWLGKKPLRTLASTLFCYLPIFMVQGIAFIWCCYPGLGWPMNGSFGVIFFAQFITSICCMIMGAFFFFLTLAPARAISLASAFTAPSFAFMGITFPTSDMSLLARTWRSILPISYYIDVQISQVSYGTDALQSLSCVTPMMIFLLPLLLLILLVRKHLKADHTQHSELSAP